MSYFKANASTNLIYLASVLSVNHSHVWTTLTQSLQEDLTERNQGNALAFPLPENDALRVFGMPRNVLLDVSHFPTSSFLKPIFFFQFRILSKPASVVRDVTIKLVDQLQAASQESSQSNRFVLCLFIRPIIHWV